MGALREKYPEELSAVISHARRLSKLLEQLEARPSRGRWFVGRSGELRTLVGSVVADWKAGGLDTQQTTESIRSFVDSLHRDAARRLRSAAAFACCRADEAITAVGDSGSIDSLTRADSVVTALSVPCAHTVRGGWMEGPEVLARFKAELDRVDVCARMVWRRLRSGSVTLDDLRAFGREGLLDAARTFDDGSGVPFGYWAEVRIRGAILDGLKGWGSIPRRLHRELKAMESREWGADAKHDGAAALARASSPASERLARATLQPDARAAMLPLYPTPTPPNPNPEDAFGKAQQLALVRALVAQLPERERELVTGYYLSGQTMEQLAPRLGLTPSWGIRLLSRALESMRSELQRGR
jgi:RNA polymerase sigma factor for flagellar operon FliA